MSEGWTSEELEIVSSGLRLLGWRFDSRLTADDSLATEEIARETIELNKAGRLTESVRDDLASRAFDVLNFQIMNVDERALMATGPFARSARFSPMLPIIDEATLCYFRGYYTAALSILFVATERILLNLLNWVPGQPKPSFKKLKAACSRLQNPDYATDAAAIINVIYADYDAGDPAPFHFNRHGLLHGLRGRVSYDQMNAVRMFGLLDVLALAEGESRGIEMSDEFTNRHRVFSSCIALGEESALLAG